MAERDPTVPQSDDAELQAEVIRLLRIVGPLGRLNVADIIVPVLHMGDVVSRAVDARPPLFTSNNLFTEGIKTSGAANELMADTGQLPMGDYDLICTLQSSSSSTLNWEVQHRNAANTANIAAFQVTNRVNADSFSERFGYTFAANERLRIITLEAFPIGDDTSAHIFAAIRT